jgi:hypothetical protein
MEVGRLPRARERGEEVVGRGRDPLLRQVREQCLGVRAAAGDRLVLRLGDVEDPDMEDPATGQDAAHLLAHERPRQVGDLEGPRDGVVIGERHQIHVPAAGLPVDRAGLRVRLVHQEAQRTKVRRSRAAGMEMEIAEH